MSQRFQELDEIMTAMITALSQHARANARHGVEQILAASSAFLSSKTHEALTDFHALYFGGMELDQKKQDINDDVSRIFDEAQALLDSGMTAEQTAELVHDDQAKAKDRMGISAMQKQLETLITFEQGFREKMAPVLASLQFEDAMSQRMAHLEAGWTDIIASLHKRGRPGLQSVAETIAASLSSQAERASFYSLVLRETPPDGVEESSIWLDLSA